MEGEKVNLERARGRARLFPHLFFLSSSLPAARARLRKILADEEAKAAAEAARPAGERSPFVKEVRGEKKSREEGARSRTLSALSLSHLSLFSLIYSHFSLLSHQSYDASDFDSLAAAYEGLAWRAVSKPGGATVKPDEFYTLYACVQRKQKREKRKREGWDGEKRGASSILLNPFLPSPSSTVSTSKPPSATSRASGPCGRSGAAWTLTAAPGGTHGPGARAAARSARGLNLSRPFGRRRPRPSTPTGAGRS